MDENTVRITTGARLHFGPLAYLPQTGRHFGGIGMMVDHPGWVVELRASVHDEAKVVGHDTGEPAKQQIISQVRETLEACRVAWSPAHSKAHCQVTVCRSIPLHAGFGSGTQLRLAVARGWRMAHGLDSGDPEELARVCGRGRRSAIGLWGFEWGGFLVDAGQREVGALGELAVRMELPEEWRVLLITPQTEEGISGSGEENWMSRLAPMEVERSGELSRIVLTEVLPALRGRELGGFRQGLQGYGDLVGDYFAQVQGGRFSHPRAAEVVDELRRSGVNGVVQSSWGPTLCAFFADEASAIAVRNALGSRFSNMAFAITPARNYGADMELR